MKSVNWWIRNFPEQQRVAIVEAINSRQLSKVKSALKLLESLPRQLRGRAFNVELLSTFNLEPLLPIIQLALNCLPSYAQVRLAPLNDIEGYIANDTGSASAEIAKARVILWRMEELLPDVLFPLTNGFPDQLRESADELLARAECVVRLHERHAPGIPLFLATVPQPISFANRLFAAQHWAGSYGAVGRFNQKIYELATSHSGTYVLDFSAWAATEGANYNNPLLDFVALQPLSGPSQLSFGFFLARSLRPLIAPRHKVLAVDLDNTLWSGVIGEDGVDGLKLGHEFPGNVHLRIQRELVELRSRGILLVLLSKNNEADARLAFESLPEMLLKRDDFAVHKVNWNYKHENLRAAAYELGLGLDSVVFVDDSDYEREQMRQFLPEVRILNESDDPLQILRALWDTDAFDSLTITEEDRARHSNYSVRTARDVRAHKDDLDAFLYSLQMEAVIEPVGPANLDRVVNMLGKTNQFNLTTRRHSRAQVQALVQKPSSIGLTLRLRDKFGEQGIVAVLVAVAGKDRRTLIVDSFLVSCRALGRGVEDTLWAAMLQRAQRQGASRLEATYIPTAKNGIVSQLYDRLGLRRVVVDSSGTHYRLEPVQPATWPPWIVNRDGASK